MNILKTIGVFVLAIILLVISFASGFVMGSNATITLTYERAKPFGVVFSHTTTPYGYIRADLYDTVLTENEALEKITSDQLRVIAALQKTLHDNNIPMPLLPYNATQVEDMPTNLKDTVISWGSTLTQEEK